MTTKAEIALGKFKKACEELDRINAQTLDVTKAKIANIVDAEWMLRGQEIRLTLALNGEGLISLSKDEATALARFIDESLASG
jgi:hypothetical protein